ncbi:MAG: DUF1573 domain-containing protein [Bacteroidetes bacterium]|nr:DUF1573 domain-containing protein [Bacteroidota bacterium]
MKKSVLLLLSLVFIAVTGQAQKAVMTFDTLQYDFGKVYAGDSAVHVFTFRNTGNIDLKIDEVKTTCYCTASKWPHEAIKPGATGEIIVAFDTHDKEGVFAKGINIYSNAGETNLIIFAEVLPKPGAPAPEPVDHSGHQH